MKHWKKQLGAACLVLSLLVPGSATAVVIPKDLPTIEALIALHKCIKKDEDQALGRVATSFGEQSLVTKGANKFNEVRTTLNTKMSNAHSYLVLAGAISSTANSLISMVEKRYGEKVFQTKIRENISIAEMPLSGQTIFEYEPKSNGAADYQTLTDEIISREENR